MNRYNGQGPGNGYRLSHLYQCGTLGTDVLNNTTAAPLRPKRTGGGHQEHDGNMAAYTATVGSIITVGDEVCQQLKIIIAPRRGLLALVAALFVSGLAGEG